jgi:hypothetical protein
MVRRLPLQEAQGTLPAEAVLIHEAADRKVHQDQGTLGHGNARGGLRALRHANHHPQCAGHLPAVALAAEKIVAAENMRRGSVEVHGRARHARGNDGHGQEGLHSVTGGCAGIPGPTAVPADVRQEHEFAGAQGFEDWPVSKGALFPVRVTGLFAAGREGACLP